jgi:hypothetical protein
MINRSSPTGGRLPGSVLPLTLGLKSAETHPAAPRDGGTRRAIDRAARRSASGENFKEETPCDGG